MAKAKGAQAGLSRRERQIMDILYRKGRASTRKVRAEMPEAPTYSAVRAMLRILEEKGHVRHRRRGPRYVYEPKVSRDRAKRSAVRHLLTTFFDNSATQAVATLLDVSAPNLSEEELARLSELIKKAKKEGR